MGDRDDKPLNIGLILLLVALVTVGFFLKRIFGHIEVVKPEQVQQEARRE